MEFDEMKKIWDSQNNVYLFSIDERALHNRVLSKQRQAYHVTHVSELLSIVAFAGSGSIILLVNSFKSTGSIAMYLMSVWMLITAACVLISRVRRIKGNRQYDASLHGSLAYGISLTTYQVRLSGLLRWNMLPIGVLILLGFWEGGKSIWAAAGLVVFLALAHVAARWEHNLYKARKRELEALKDKLDHEDSARDHQ